MKKKYLVSDTNILLDLLSVDMLALFFSLPFEFHTTDLVISEIKKENQKKEIQKYIDKGVLIVKTFSPEEVLNLSRFFASLSNKISIQDYSVWVYAKTISAHLLTADLCLRKLVEKENKIKVNGVIFVFDELIKQKSLTTNIACEKLKILLSINPRLPNRICNERISFWTKGNHNWEDNKCMT